MTLGVGFENETNAFWGMGEGGQIEKMSEIELRGVRKLSPCSSLV